MKTSFFNLFLISIVLVFTASCNTEPTVKSLEDNLNKNVERLSSAVENINASTDFQLLSQNDESALSEASKAPSVSITDFLPNDTVLITLNGISGVYEYSWLRVKSNNPIVRYFTKTAESDYMIVRLPLKKVRYPLTMFFYQAADSSLTNNFEAKVTDYYVFRNLISGKEYRLTSDFSIDNSPIGTLTELRTKNKVNGLNTSSVYTLASGYTVSCTVNSGDTAVSAYSISEGDKILYEEKLTSVKITGTKIRHRENTYSLTIGNVQIVRTQGPNSLDSADVYLNGLLQSNAKVEIVIEQPDSLNQSITYAKRDLKITFDDGSSTTIRTLMGETVDGIGEIFKAVEQANFATFIIDRIAWNIYIRKQ